MFPLFLALGAFVFLANNKARARHSQVAPQRQNSSTSDRPFNAYTGARLSADSAIYGDVVQLPSDAIQPPVIATKLVSPGNSFPVQLKTNFAVPVATAAPVAPFLQCGTPGADPAYCWMLEPQFSGGGP